MRSRIGQPSGDVQRFGAIMGFAEAPTISADGTTLSTITNWSEVRLRRAGPHSNDTDDAASPRSIAEGAVLGVKRLLLLVRPFGKPAAGLRSALASTS